MRALLITALASILMPAFASASTYDCAFGKHDSYSLITNHDGTVSLENGHIKAEKLTVASQASGSSKATWFEGSFVPEGMNILQYITVSVDNLLLDGKPSGNIRVKLTAQGKGKVYRCVPNTAKNG